MDAVDQVMAATRARASALADADAGRLASLLHEEFRWTSHSGESFRREEYIKRNTEGQTIWRSQDLGDSDVVVVGDTAVLYTEVSDVVLSDEDEPTVFRMPMTQVWIRSGGSWKCLAGHAGPRQI